MPRSASWSAGWRVSPAAVADGTMAWDPELEGRRAPQPRVGARRSDRRRGREAADGSLTQRSGRRGTFDCGRVARSTGSTKRWSRFEMALVGLAEREGTAVPPGARRIQPAQPVLFAHHLLAYVEMAKHNRARLADARRRANVSPLGAGPLAGAGFPLDREASAPGARLRRRDRQLTRCRERPGLRHQDDRRVALGMVHLSRLAEENDLVVEPPVRLRAGE